MDGYEKGLLEMEIGELERGFEEMKVTRENMVKRMDEFVEEEVKSALGEAVSGSEFGGQEKGAKEVTP